jgi:uncharacterized damage-inducible protein DinB
MALSEILLPDFDEEMAATRTTLERVPDGKFDWKPHVKSMAMGQLAQHLATIPHWGSMIIKQESLDVAPGGVPLPQLAQVKTTAEILEMFDKNVGETRAGIARASDEELRKTWSLLVNGKTVVSMPRIACLRGFVMYHNVHHRAQLGVYLRLNDVPVPAIYGPSADENRF